MSTNIYTGIWINHEYGRILGPTLTLKTRDGSLLLSFIAAFVAVAGNRLWRIISYFIHQVLASADPKDGVFHQRQAVLRNNASSIGTAWTILQMTWFWSKVSRRAVVKTFPLIIFSVGFSIIFAVATIFSSQVAKGSSSARLMKSEHCGIWTGGKADTNLMVTRSKYTAEAFRATSYTRSCYTETPTNAECALLYRPRLPFNSTNDIACPFEQKMCRDGHVHHVDTGFLDSHCDLGINAVEEDRILLRKQATCTPLPTGDEYKYFLKGHEAVALGLDDDVVLRYMYGDTHGRTSAGVRSTYNYTFSYNTNGIYTDTGYQITTVQSPAGFANAAPWTPIPALKLDDNTDLSIFFIAFNSIRFTEECQDPVFGAKHLNGSGTTIMSTRYVAPIACSETYTFCNTKGVCTPAVGTTPLWDHAVKDLNLNTVQLATITRLMQYLPWINLYQSVLPRPANALRAQDTVFELEQPYLPDNQWEIEIEGWFADTLAKLQYLVAEYADQPKEYLQYGDELVQLWKDDKNDLSDALRAMCFNQLVNDGHSTMSFSIAGLVVIFTIGGSLIFLSLFIETLVAFVQKKTGYGLIAQEAWLQDETIKLQSALFEQAGLGSWIGRQDAIPVTTTAQPLDVWSAIFHRQSLRSSHDESMLFMPDEKYGNSQTIKRKPVAKTQETELYPAPSHRV